RARHFQYNNSTPLQSIC
ncbi:hypothetical protein D044_0741B, partial [Vibrio parahaemolyticus EKP-026]